MITRLKFKIINFILAIAIKFLTTKGYRILYPYPKTKSQWIDMTDGKKYAILRK